MLLFVSTAPLSVTRQYYPVMDAVALGLIGAVVLFVSYVYSLSVNPDRDCWWCQGKPNRRGWFYFWSRGACGRCGGSGKHVRFGRRIMNRMRGNR